MMMVMPMSRMLLMSSMEISTIGAGFSPARSSSNRSQFWMAAQCPGQLKTLAGLPRGQALGFLISA